jgi:hypothetical protein
MSKVNEALARIQASPDTTERAMFLAALISTLMRIRGVELVMVGDIAFDCYADRSGTSAHLTLCLLEGRLNARLMQEVLGAHLGGTGMTWKWEIAGVSVKLGGQVLTDFPGLCRDFKTDFGVAKVIPAEELVAERILASVYPARNAVAHEEARHLMALALADVFAMDWEILLALCQSKSYSVADQFTALRQEADREARRLMAAAAVAAADEPPEPIPTEEFDTGDAYAPVAEAREVVGLRTDTGKVAFQDILPPSKIETTRLPNPTA